MTTNETKDDNGRQTSAKPFIVAAAEIPESVKQLAAQKIGAEAKVYGSRQDGSYRGRILGVVDGYMVQEIGAVGAATDPNRHTRPNAVVHRLDTVKLEDAKLGWAKENGKIEGMNAQVHYKGDAGKAYRYTLDRAAPAKAEVSKDAMAAKAEAYIAENVKGPKKQAELRAHLAQMGVIKAPEPAKEVPAKGSPARAQRAAPERASAGAER